MSDAEVRTFLLGAVVGLIAMGVLWALATWRRRRRTTPTVTIQQIQLPIANPTLVSQPGASLDVSIETDDTDSQQEPGQRSGPDNTALPANAVKQARYHRQLVSLSLELERVEQENNKLKGQWRSSQRQLVRAETGLDQARSEIADIRDIVLQLGATKADENVIDLR